MTPAEAAAQVIDGYNEPLWLFIYDKLGSRPPSKDEVLKVIEGMTQEERECYMVEKQREG